MNPGQITEKDKEQEREMMRKVDESCLRPPDGNKNGYILPTGSEDTTTQFCIRVRQCRTYHLLLIFKTEDEVRKELSVLGKDIEEPSGNADKYKDDDDDDNDDDEEDEDDNSDDDDEDSDDDDDDDDASARRSSKEQRCLLKIRRLIAGHRRRATPAQQADRLRRLCPLPRAAQRKMSPLTARRAGHGGAGADDGGGAARRPTEIRICARVRQVKPCGAVAPTLGRSRFRRWAGG